MGTGRYQNRPSRAEADCLRSFEWFVDEPLERLEKLDDFAPLAGDDALQTGKSTSQVFMRDGQPAQMNERPRDENAGLDGGSGSKHGRKHDGPVFRERDRLIPPTSTTTL